jgi:hypothetical protein
MREAGHDSAPGDPIEEYLARLRASLRVAPPEAELILAEAEDHLRETAAAGMAIGLTEREAHEAAISSFGSVGAVIRAHQARRGRVAAVLGDVSMAAWRLASLLLVTSGVSGLATMAIFALFLQPIVNVPVGTQVATINPDLQWLVYSATAAIGVILLTSYRLTRRRQRRRGLEREPLAGFFPVVAASFFGVVAVLLFVLNVSGVAVFFDPGLVVAALLILAASYAIQTARTHRRPDPPR